MSQIQDRVAAPVTGDVLLKYTLLFLGCWTNCGNSYTVRILTTLFGGKYLRILDQAHRTAWAASKFLDREIGGRSVEYAFPPDPMEKHPVVEAQALPLSAETINQVVNSIAEHAVPSI